MRNLSLAEDYVRRARKRLAALDALYGERAWPDVVREAQEVVELALKAILRRYRIDTPRLHDVSDLLVEAKPALSEALAQDVERLCEISRRLRRDRELAFYGSEDLTPSDFYREKDAREARDDARFVVETAEREFRTQSATPPASVARP
jgi:HEPN domain-containing protein